MNTVYTQENQPTLKILMFRLSFSIMSRRLGFGSEERVVAENVVGEIDA
jgi:hypothetical protein